MKTNKLYFPKDALSRHENFDVWYADGDLALRFEGEWASEKEKIAIIGRWGGETAHIKPDHNTVSYYLRVECYEYVLRTYRIFQHYGVDGMRWDIHGSLAEGSFFAIHEDTGQKDVSVRLTTLPGKGECYEVKVKDVAKLRIALIAVVAMGIKEEYCGLSEGEKDMNAGRVKKMKKFLFPGKGEKYEEPSVEE